MAKRKSGLHKEISSIFDGIPHPGQEQNEKSSVLNERTGGAGLTSSGASERKIFIPDMPRADTPLPQKPKNVPQSIPQRTPPRKQSEPAKSFSQISGDKSDILKTIGSAAKKVLTPKEGVDPKKHFISVILVPILFIVFLIVFYRALNPKGGDSIPAAVSPVSDIATGKIQSASVGIKWQIPDIYPETLRDPMQMQMSRRMSADSQVDGTLPVKGILFSENPSAIIGTQIVKEGEEVYGVKVVKINKDSVEFEQNGKKWIQKIEK